MLFGPRLILIYIGNCAAYSTAMYILYDISMCVDRYTHFYIYIYNNVQLRLCVNND